MASKADATERTPLLGEQQSDSNQAQRSQIQPDEEQNETQPTAGNDILLEEEPTTAKLMGTLGVVWFGVLFAAIDSTIVATLSAPISNSFDSFTLVSWLATGYLISNAAFQPLSGKLTDIYGRRAGLIVSQIFFTAGTLMCGLAKSEGVILAGRVIAGMGGGCMNAIATYLASDIIPLRKRGVWQGLGNIVWGAGGAVGGLFGGWINDIKNWRWAFLVQVPFMAFSTVLIYFAVKIPVKESDKSRIKRVDFAGAFTLVASLVLLLLGLNSGGNLVPWNHPLVYVSLPLAGVILGIWVYIEANVASEPMIPVRLLLNRTVAAACLTNWFGSMAYFAFLYYCPIYFQILGASSTMAGLKIIPAAVGLSIGSLGSGYLMRLTGRYYWYSVINVSLLVISGVLMVIFLRRDVADWPSYLMFFLNGVGFGGMLTITLLALISAVDHEHQAVITAASYAARSTGSSIGITTAGTVFQNFLVKALWNRLGDHKHAAEVIQHLRDNFKYIDKVPAGWYDDVLDAYMEALRAVWVTVLSLFVLATITSLFMREHTLYSNLARK